MQPGSSVTTGSAVLGGAENHPTSGSEPDTQPDTEPDTGSAEPVMDEASAVARAQDGDLDAFEALVDRYQAPIFRLAMRLLRDRAQAEDVAQDTFVAAWRKLPTLVEPAAFRGWLYQVATRRSLDVLRRRRPQQPLDDELEAEPVGAAGQGQAADPALTAVRNAELADFRRVLAELPDELRTCWMLKELDGLSYAEIATALHLQPSTVRGRIARARQHLGMRMQPWR